MPSAVASSNIGGTMVLKLAESEHRNSCCGRDLVPGKLRFAASDLRTLARSKVGICQGVGLE